MLLRFWVTNFLSFDRTCEFSMIADGYEHIHKDHVYRFSSEKHFHALRSSVFYGANASGKTNFVKAIAMAKSMIIRGTSGDQKLPYKPFKLSKNKGKQPTTFEFEFHYGGKNYRYGFKYNDQSVTEEWLFTFTKYSEQALFLRGNEKSRDKELNGKVRWLADGSFAYGNWYTKLESEEKDFLRFVAKGTRPNQLFLKESIDRNVKHFRPAYDWFKDALEVIFPNSVATGLEHNLSTDPDVNLKDFLSELLRNADTGIDHIHAVKSKPEEVTDIPARLREDIAQDLKDERTVIQVQGPGNQRYTFTKNKKGEVQIHRLVAGHRVKGKSEPAYFEISEESDGTCRLIDLGPSLNELMHTRKERVIVIDELERSLHPHLSKMLLEMHLQHAGPNTPSQLLATTHDLGLMDLQLLRRDELWFVQKNADQATELYSLSEFSPRFDKHIRKDYMEGRYRAIPHKSISVRLRSPKSVPHAQKKKSKPAKTS